MLRSLRQTSTLGNAQLPRKSLAGTHGHRGGVVVPPLRSPANDEPLSQPAASWLTCRLYIAAILHCIAKPEHNIETKQQHLGIISAGSLEDLVCVSPLWGRAKTAVAGCHLPVDAAPIRLKSSWHDFLLLPAQQLSMLQGPLSLFAPVAVVDVGSHCGTPA